ncbi:MAG: hypothetical protein NTW86_23020 [Candidatus Sumerlaeota bacterium]|nr:hypothetical protein [Candidatus Sumerlaeota bacterium]
MMRLSAAAILVVSMAVVRAEAVQTAVNNWSRDSIVDFYNTFYQPGKSWPSGWTGDVDQCIAGDTSADFKAAVLGRVNYFRGMCALPAVAFNDVKSYNCAEAALIVSRNNYTGEDPPDTLKCWTLTGHDAVQKSLRTLGVAGPDSVDLYMQSANNTFCRQRRWLLYPPQVSMGNGAVTPTAPYSPANALWAAGPMGTRPLAPTVVVWPPMGFVPLNLLFDRWSFSYNRAYDNYPNDHVDFTHATVSMWRNGAPLSLTVDPVYPAFNSSVYIGDHTLVWRPSGLNPAEGVHYQVLVNNVVVDGVAQRFSYDVYPIDATQPSTEGEPAIYGAGDGGGGKINLTWLNYHSTPAQFLGFAYDIYAANWVGGGYNNSMWFLYPNSSVFGQIDAKFSGAYHAWISSQYPDSTWYACANPWTGILYSGAPHTPIQVSAQDQGNHVARLSWKTDIYGTWRYLMIVYDGANWINVTGPSGNALWQAVYYPGADFSNGRTDLALPAAGDYTIFIQGQGWLPPYPLGGFGAAGVHVN